MSALNLRSARMTGAFCAVVDPMTDGLRLWQGPLAGGVPGGAGGRYAARVLGREK